MVPSCSIPRSQRRRRVEAYGPLDFDGRSGEQLRAASASEVGGEFEKLGRNSKGARSGALSGASHVFFPRFIVVSQIFCLFWCCFGAHLMRFACECVNVMFVRRLSACHLPQASLANLSDRDRAVQKAENFIGCRGGRNL